VQLNGWIGLFKRLGFLATVLVGASLVLFTAVHQIPGDPIMLRMKNPPPEVAGAERERLGLDEPLPMQYLHYVGGFVRGDWGRSFQSNRPVFKDVMSYLPATLELSIAALTLGTLVGVPLALLATAARVRIFRILAHGSGVIGLVVPIFWLGIMLIVVGNLWLGAFPSGGRWDFAYDLPRTTGFVLPDLMLAGRWDLLTVALHHLALPTVCLAFYPASVVVNVVMGRLNDPMTRKLIVALKARGVSPVGLWLKHLLKLCGAPLVTALGSSFGALLGGAVLTETVFSWPGMGRYLINAILSKDLFVLENGLLFVIMLVFVVVNIADQLAYSLNPTLKRK